MDIIERVKKIIDWLVFENVIKNRKDLAEKIGYTESSLSQILNGKVPLTDKFIKKLLIYNNRINEVWLRTGYGEMLYEPETVKILNELSMFGEPQIGYDRIPQQEDNREERLMDIIKNQEKTIRDQQETIKNQQETIKNQQETIKTLSETVKNLSIK